MPVALSDLGGGARAWSPENIGDKISGRITLAEQRQQRNLDTKQLEFWPDGQPKMLLYIELETDTHIDENDDGMRALYAKGGVNFEAAQGEGQAMSVAIAEAVKATGERQIEEGAQLAVAFTGLAKPTARGMNPAKLYRAQYKAPISSVSVNDLFDE